MDESAVTTDWESEGEPAVTVNEGRVLVTGEPPSVAPTVVAVPAAAAVKIAVYVPLPWSTVEPKLPVLVPPEELNTTVVPPVPIGLPAPSFAVSVAVMVAPEETEPEESVMID